MKFNHYPTAIEVRYRFILEDIYAKINKSSLHFIDITMYNSDVIKYLENKGFVIVDIRYEYNIDNDSKTYGFFGRKKGDGHCLCRIIWGDVDRCMEMYGNFL